VPIWLFAIIVFAGVFLGAFLASAFYVSKREDDRSEGCRNGESTN
jgi:hypothetical protein